MRKWNGSAERLKTVGEPLVRPPAVDFLPPAATCPRVLVEWPSDLTTAARALFERVIGHAGLVIERLLFLSRHTGLLPRKSSADDPLGSMVISDADVAAILSSLKKSLQPNTESAPSSVKDPFIAQLHESRSLLKKQLELPASKDVGLVRLVRAFQLGDVEIDLFALALAPDWDLRIARLTGFLNNDATDLRPKMGHLMMAAQTRMPGPAADIYDRMEYSLFLPGLLERDPDPKLPIARQSVRVAENITGLCMSMFRNKESSAVDRSWDTLLWTDEDKQVCRRALHRELHRRGAKRLVVLEGPPGSGRLAMARAAAIDCSMEVELCELGETNGDEKDKIAAVVTNAIYRAKLGERLLVIRGDGLLAQLGKVMHMLAQKIAEFDVPCFLTARAGELDKLDPGLRMVKFTPPRLTPLGKRELWQREMGNKHLSASDPTLDDLAARFDLTPGRLCELVEELQIRQAWSKNSSVEVADVRGTLRDITVQRFTNLANRYDSEITLEDLVFADSVSDRLEELVGRLRNRHRVLSGWNFADKAHESFGVSALFVGPPGTGKTAGAVAIANALDIDLFVVDFSSIMSKWVGETEQNLARIFDEAEASSVALLFDEADSLFGKRSSEQQSSSDRYANLTVNYLLQRMETYSGLVILTTNMESAMDEAFQRRITFRVRFPGVDETLRENLWRHLLPADAEYAEDVDFVALGRMQNMQGAHIRRALTRAAFRVASTGVARPVLAHKDLLWAIAAEYEDLGRLVYHNDEDSPTGASSLAASSMLPNSQPAAKPGTSFRYKQGAETTC